MWHCSRLISLVVFCSLLSGRQGDSPKSLGWRAATEGELKEMIPARAPVGEEHIETEFRTASGIINGKGQYVAGVVLITAGYSADGKYSHFFLTQIPVRVGDIRLKPGNYVFGWQRESDSLRVRFYEAQTGKLLGTLQASRNSTIGKIESFHLYPPGEKSLVQIGRFGFSYKIVE